MSCAIASARSAPTSASIDHSRAVARFLREAGIRAQHLDGDPPSTERRRLIAALASNEIQVITNCALISEGLDVPALDGVILWPRRRLHPYIRDEEILDSIKTHVLKKMAGIGRFR
jgi:excinuclease UvrABC helicase subunit UvrB